jgi:hypothetical protein
LVLLHYHVVPGFGDDPGPRSETTAIRADEAAPVDAGAVAAIVTAPPEWPCQPVEVR